MSGNCELGRGLRSREKNATEAAAGRFEKPAPDAKAAPPEAHESLISRKTVAEVPLTGLSLGEDQPRRHLAREAEEAGECPAGCARHESLDGVGHAGRGRRRHLHERLFGLRGGCRHVRRSEAHGGDDEASQAAVENGKAPWESGYE